MLRIERVAVAVEGRIVVKRASLELRRGEVNLLLGPNGSGKSSLLNAVMGHPKYVVVAGKVLLDGNDITHLNPEARVRLGLALAVQHPPRIRGVRVGKLLEKLVLRHVKSVQEAMKEVQNIAKLLNISHLLDRDLGVGFSGGEMKRIELASLMALRPRIALIDEPDSGVDVDSVLLIAEAIEEMMSMGTQSILIVTHTGLIAKHVKHHRAYVMVDGEIVAEGSSEKILPMVLEHGFSAVVSCAVKRDE